MKHVDLRRVHRVESVLRSVRAYRKVTRLATGQDLSVSRSNGSWRRPREDARCSPMALLSTLLTRRPTKVLGPLHRTRRRIWIQHVVEIKRGRLVSLGPPVHLPAQRATRPSLRPGRTQQPPPRPAAFPRTRNPTQGVYPPNSGHYQRVTSPPSAHPSQAAYYPLAPRVQAAVCSSLTKAGARNPVWSPVQGQTDRYHRMSVDASPGEKSQAAAPAHVRPSPPSASSTSAAVAAADGTSRSCCKRSTVPPGAPATDAGPVETAGPGIAAVVSGASVPRGMEHPARGPGMRLVVAAAAA